jgi:HlyD family secretion protein
MDTPSPKAHIEDEPRAKKAPAKKATRSYVPSIIVAAISIAIIALSIWYLVRPEPLLVQGEIDATRMDIAARVDGRVADIPVERGHEVPAGAVLVRIDNPETLAKRKQAVAAKVVAEAQLTNINAGTREEVIAARKAELDRAKAAVVLAQKTFDRTNDLAQKNFSPQAQLDLARDRLEEAQKAQEQAQSNYSQALNGYTKEEHEIAAANVQKAIADIDSVQSIIDQMVVYAPVASQVSVTSSPASTSRPAFH